MKVLSKLSAQQTIHNSKHPYIPNREELRKVCGGSGTHKGKDPTEGEPDNATRFIP
ncbi:hypothetical protein [Pseudoalteromonas luteoviolacea]|uniref:hypothetical protein n=1 Tax=Pseudoalteromonas luteoviolacea TaxID=43657 RepID=UPI00163BB371|nr:hypothetical protein [Pseudoalteromonas luteoviolacea]